MYDDERRRERNADPDERDGNCAHGVRCAEQLRAQYDDGADGDRRGDSRQPP